MEAENPHNKVSHTGVLQKEKALENAKPPAIIALIDLDPSLPNILKLDASETAVEAVISQR